MLSPQVIQTCIDDLKNITRTELVVVDEKGSLIARNAESIVIDKERVIDFVVSIPPTVMQFGNVAIPIIEYFELRLLPAGTTGINPSSIARLNNFSNAFIINIL